MQQPLARSSCQQGWRQLCWAGAESSIWGRNSTWGCSPDPREGTLLPTFMLPPQTPLR